MKMKVNKPSATVILFHGPTFAGKHTIFFKELSKTHKAICPSDIYEKNQDVGVRDVGLQILKCLKKNDQEKFAILDENRCRKTRESYVRLLKTKVKDITLAMWSVLPQYGCEQLFWSREIRLAEESLNLENGYNVKDLCDSSVWKWFKKDTDVNVAYQHGLADQPSEDEGYTVYSSSVPIYARSKYKFEVPGLFIQWESIHRLVTDTRSDGTRSLMEILHNWAQANPCGRIIVVCDGSQILIGKKTKSQEKKQIDEAFKIIIKEFTEMPIYVYHIMDPKQAGCYVVPPKPGILAYEQRRHCLNLHSRRSLYVYEASCHQKMAEAAGLRHIKASRLLQNPALISSGHACSTQPIPAMLSTMKVILDLSQTEPLVPLLDQSMHFSDGNVCQLLKGGRTEYLYAMSWDIVERYAIKYKTMATVVGECHSSISRPQQCHINISAIPVGKVEQSTVDDDQTQDLSSDSKWSIESLPKYNIKTENSLCLHSISAKSRPKCVFQTNIKNTMYILTEKELIEAASEVLRKAGDAKKVSILKKEHGANMENEKLCKTTYTVNKLRPDIVTNDSLSCYRNEDELNSECSKIELNVSNNAEMVARIHNSKQNDKERNDKEIHDGAVEEARLHSINFKEVVIDNGSLEADNIAINDCDPTVKDRDVPRRVHISDRANESLSKNRYRDRRRQEVVSDVLDAFSSTKVSPLKRARFQGNQDIDGANPAEHSVIL